MKGRCSFLEPIYQANSCRRIDDDEKNIAGDLLPQRVYDPGFISTAPSSYRRIRRSRSLFSITQSRNPQPKAFANPDGSEDLRPRRSMSFLRGGTEFMPASQRRENQASSKERKSLYSFGSLSSRGENQFQTEVTLQEKPRSLRMKVRKMSSSFVNSMRRALFSISGKDNEGMGIPPQHIMSNRPYFGVYNNASDLDKENEDSSPDLFMYRVNSGAPTLRHVPSSIGYPSRSGSIRIVTPPALSTTPLSSSGNTWASSTTASTLRSGTSTKRLSIIRETTPKNDGEAESKGLPRAHSRVIDAQRVYSAFLRVSRAKNASTVNEKDQPTPENEYSLLSRDGSTLSRPSTASTMRRGSCSPKKSTINSFQETPCPSPRQSSVTENKENISPSQVKNEVERPVSKTHVIIGPRITLYPPPEQTMTHSKDKNDKSESELKMTTIRHMHSAFFPYSAGSTMVGSSPSPYKRATAMSPDVPSIYSRTTSGDTPEPATSMDSPILGTDMKGENSGHRDHFVQLGRRVSLVRMNQSRDEAFPNRMTPSPSANTLASFHTAKTRRDENIPLSTYLPGLTRPGEAPNLIEEASPSPSTVAGSFGMSFFNRARERRENNALQVSRNGGETGRGDSRKRYRVLTAKNIPETVARSAQGPKETQPLAGIDSNIESTASNGDKRASWMGIRLSNHSRPTLSFGKRSNNTSLDNNLTENDVTVANAKDDGTEGKQLTDQGRNEKQITVGSGLMVEEPSEFGPWEGGQRELGQETKFSFEVNDDRDVVLSGRQGLGLKAKGPRMLLRNEVMRNASVESDIGAFL